MGCTMAGMMGSGDSFSLLTLAHTKSMGRDTTYGVFSQRFAQIPLVQDTH
jgi:hypothetical protein